MTAARSGGDPHGHGDTPDGNTPQHLGTPGFGPSAPGTFPRDTPAPDTAAPGTPAPGTQALGGPALLAGAEKAAAEAASLCGVQVRELHDISDFELLARLFDDIWHPDPENPPLTVEMARAFSHAGNFVAGAFDRDTLVGASAGFYAAPVGEVLHSHVTGAIKRGAGFALKLHQRAWALRHGLSRITWTYDPLVRRNAYFNLAKLGARPEEYLREFYGTMADAINAGDESDRMLAVWRLGEPGVVEACGRKPYRPEIPADAVVAISQECGRPVVGRTTGRVVLVALPEDIETLRRGDPGAAKAWRHAVRDVLGGLMGEGARVIGFARDGYVVART